METYISCHALLRLVLSKTLNKEPLEVRFFNELYNKPALLGNPLYFNISHTKGAFAFVVSNNHYVGIDLEKVSKIIDFTSIIETYFSSCEREYILESKAEALDRFFLLWTRKEALLKALGTGIIDNLKQVEVLENIIRREVFDNLIADCLFDDHFIYSTNLSNHFLSVAIPQRGKVLLYQINNEIINLYINQ